MKRISKIEIIYDIVYLGLNETRGDYVPLDAEDIQEILDYKYNINLELHQIGGYLSILLQKNKIKFEDPDYLNLNSKNLL